MDTATQLNEVVRRLRKLSPTAIRSRLLEIEQEEKALRVLLRAKIKGESRPETDGGAS